MTDKGATGPRTAAEEAENYLWKNAALTVDEASDLANLHYAAP